MKVDKDICTLEILVQFTTLPRTPYVTKLTLNLCSAQSLICKMEATILSYPCYVFFIHLNPTHVLITTFPKFKRMLYP